MSIDVRPIVIIVFGIINRKIYIASADNNKCSPLEAEISNKQKYQNIYLLPKKAL
jgi:hypothetical protein